jgi:lipid A 4'-phosphatase
MSARMKGLTLYFGLLLTTTAAFVLAPGIDLAISALFYDPQHGFPLGDWPAVRSLEATIPWISRTIFVVAAAAGLWLALVGRVLWRFDRKAILFIVIATGLGPGILVNTVLKDHWGRARPVQIEAFGGTKEFTPAPLAADQCTRNCSFVSGHAALAFSLVGFAFLLPRGWARRAGQVAALGFGGLIGLGRIAAGAHFLSDIVFAGLLVYGTSWLLYGVIVEQDVLAAPGAMRLYRAAGEQAAAGWRQVLRAYATPVGRAGLWISVVAILTLVLIGWVDRPAAQFVHAAGPGVHALFENIGRLGLTYPYFVLFGLVYAMLRWGGRLAGLQHRAERMRAAAVLPAFCFASLAASGLVVDALKVLCGRARPKLLFADGTYDFAWFALRAEHWSFPSGHAATVAALMTALWCLWPRHLLFYIAIGTVVAGSRVISGAHYPSDVLIGAFIAVLTTRALEGLFADRRVPLAWPAARRRGSAVSQP